MINKLEINEKEHDIVEALEMIAHTMKLLKDELDHLHRVTLRILEKNRKV